MTLLARWRAFRESRQWFRIGRCAYCGRWSLYILASEDMHEECWLDTK